MRRRGWRPAMDAQLVEQRAAEVRVEIADLGNWGGRATLISEYDPEADAIRVNVHAFERVRAALGPAEAERLFDCAVAHERFHRAHPFASEAEAVAHAEASTGAPAERYAAVLAPTKRGGAVLAPRFRRA